MSPGGFIYAIGAAGTTHVKIGSTSTTVEKRRAQLQTGHPSRLYILASLRVDAEVQPLEKAMHGLFAAVRQQGEWFAIEAEVNQAWLEAVVPTALQWIADAPVRQAEEAARKAAARQEAKMSDIVAERVRKAREYRGWSQKELAKRATIHHVVLNRLEKGHKSGVQAETIRRLADALHVTSDYLLGLSDKLETRAREKTGEAA